MRLSFSLYLIFSSVFVFCYESILDAEGITCYFHAEHLYSIRPLTLPARLMIIADQVENAKEILKDAKLSIMAITIGSALPEWEVQETKEREFYGVNTASY